MRLGWDEDSLNAPELARRAEAEGAAMLTVHGRTRSQFYKGSADWTAIRPVCAAVKIPVVANGDCRSPQDARDMLAQSGAQAAMIGRAALGRPWLVGDIAYFLRFGQRPAASSGAGAAGGGARTSRDPAGAGGRAPGPAPRPQTSRGLCRCRGASRRRARAGGAAASGRKRGRGGGFRPPRSPLCARAPRAEAA